MALFGKKKNEEIRLPTIETIMPQKTAEEIRQGPQTVKQEPMGAPLFVKIEKYDRILTSISELKNSLAVMKSAFVVLNQVEKLKMESLNALQGAIENSERKVAFLNSELLKLPGQKEEVKRDIYRVEDFEGVLSELKNQVGHLKAELRQTS